MGDAWSTVLGVKTMELICMALPEIADALNEDWHEEAVEVASEKTADTLNEMFQKGYTFKASIQGKTNLTRILIFRVPKKK